MAADEPGLAAAPDTDRQVPVVTSLSLDIRRELDGRDIGQTYQFACLEAWRACGFKVISVNAEAEVPRLRAMYPDVEIVAAEAETIEFRGKPLVPLSELVRVLAGTGARVGGIVASDVFVPPCRLAAWLSVPHTHDLLFMRRREIDHPMLRNGPVHRLGFDAFFCDTRKAAALSWGPFAIGLPWWDHVLPTAFLFAGHEIAEIEGLPLLRLTHEQTWDEAIWLRMYEAFRERFAPGIAELVVGGDDAGALGALMFEDRMSSYYAERGGSKRSGDWNAEAAKRYRRAYARSVVDLIMQKSSVVPLDEGEQAERRWR